MNLVNGLDQLHAVRVAGAMAHELNNPLQGLMSQLTLACGECTDNEVLRQRLAELSGGVNRLSRAVRNFSALYENMPRTADRATLALVVSVMDAALSARGFLTEGGHSLPDTTVLCMTDEVAHLFPEVVAIAAAPSAPLTWVIECREHESAVKLVYRLDSRGADWTVFNESDGLSGLPVLLDELVRLADGRLELMWEGDTWIGTGIVLKHV
jgi:signal transduction histidine kinase